MNARWSWLLVAMLWACGPDSAYFSAEEGGDELESVSAELTYRPLRPPGRSIHVAEVNLCEAGLELRATGPGDGTRTVSSFAARVGALVAINGGHSWSGAPSVSASGGQFFGRPDATDVGQAAFGPGVADFIHMRASYARSATHREVVSGLLTLVHDGVAQHALLPHGEPTCSVQHPRTLLGLTRDKRKLLMVVVDGRAPEAGRRGMTCREAADFMVAQGAHWALNLDGGGSSAMVVNGRVVNVPSDGRERPVPTHLAVVRTPGARGHCPVAPPTPPPAPASCGRLRADGSLKPGEALQSCNGRFTLTHQPDGNVVLRDGGAARWSTGTAGRSSGLFVMQGDGNLVLYTPAWSPLWNARTHGNPGARVDLQDDGNLVVRAADGRVLWSSGTAVAPTPAPAPTPPPAPPPAPTPPPTPPPAPTPAPTCGTLGSGAALARGQSVRSCDGRFTFTHQADGNVVLYQGSTVRWQTATAGRATSNLVMQTDGNLVLYASTGAALWNSRTAGHGGAALAVQNDGNVVIYAGGRAVWHTQTCCR